MEKGKVFRSALLALSLFVMQNGRSQVSTPFNVPTSPGTDYVGWNNSTTVPLEIRHDAADQPIEFHTAGDFRARINPRITYGTLGSFSSVPAHGFALITPNNSFFNTVKGPFTRLHLADGGADNAQQLAFRPWMSNGITFTGNADHGYMGQKYQGADLTDMVVHWSDNPGNERKDRLRFLFTSGYDPSASSGAQSLEGLEGMRLWPKSFREVNVGVGDFYADGTEPTERLHVLNGRVRIEELPNDLEAEGLTKVVVVDDAATDEHGVLKWMNIANLIPVDCEWQMNTGANNHLYTAQGPADPNCPDGSDAVMVGVAPGGVGTVSAKVHVRSTNNFVQGMDVRVSNTTGLAFGAVLNATGSGQSVRGVQAFSHGSSQVGYAGDFHSFDFSPYASGVNAVVHNGTGYAVGVDGVARSSGLVNAGIVGTQQTTSVPLPPNGNYGVFGAVQNQSTAIGTDWAGYFRGNVNVTGTGVIPGGTWSPSDEALKENIEVLEGGLSVIAQLNPRSYDYQVDAYPHVDLPVGQQFGFLAQELEQVIPGAVKDITFPAQSDSSGQEIHPAIASKIVNTSVMIPFLVSAIQELNARNGALAAQMNDLQDAFAACCTNPDGSRMQAPTNTTEPALEDRGDERKLRIVPNPFNERTTVFYTLERGGRTQLMANSADGRELRVLQEADQAAGEHQFQWNTASLAPGMYYVTLLLDGKPVVKKGVKVAR
ncbi:MAG TPA: tail fiber domain-containing protein [Flavobacteriales bacterium]|nr:tail fiber domain-containing protein [Flavobacteriales bacterium]